MSTDLAKTTELEKVTKLEALKKLAARAKRDADIQVKKAIAEAGHAKFEKVEVLPEVLPEVADAIENVMYLLHNAETNHYDIYAKIGDKLEQLDDTSIDLSGYVEKEEGKELITTEEKTKLNGIAEGATKVEQGTKEGTILINGQEITLYEVATEEEIDAILDEVFGASTETA